jgi:hypothetical protein
MRLTKALLGLTDFPSDTWPIPYLHRRLGYLYLCHLPRAQSNFELAIEHFQSAAAGFAGWHGYFENLQSISVRLEIGMAHYLALVRLARNKAARSSAHPAVRDAWKAKVARRLDRGKVSFEEVSEPLTEAMNDISLMKVEATAMTERTREMGLRMLK